MPRLLLLTLVTIATGCWLAWSIPQGRAATPSEPSRVVYVSLDAAADWIVDRLIERGKAPAFAALSRDGARAEAMVTTLPTLTAVAHASLWTGTTPAGHGILGNSMVRLPRREHTVLEARSGFLSDPLEAEPIWSSAGRAGKRVLVLQATQVAPFIDVNQRVLQFDIYANRLLPRQIIEGRVSDVPYAFHVGETPFTLRRTPGAKLILHGGTTTELQPGLTGSFNPPVPVVVNGHSSVVQFRLLSYDPRSGAFRLYQDVVSELTSSDPARIAAFRRAAGGLLGDDISGDYETGVLGPTLAEGGNGDAERWLTQFVRAEQQYFDGAARFAATEDWDLLIVYVPTLDTALHALAGMIDPQSSTYSESTAARIWPIVEEIFATTADRFVGDVRSRFTDATLVVVGDHGMEGSGRVVFPNAALREAGLLKLTPDKQVDLPHTEAVVLTGNYVFINTIDWKDGAVPIDRRGEVKRRAAAALLGIRDPATGEPAIRSLFDPEVDQIVPGGPAAGDLWFDTAIDFYSVGRVDGERPTAARPPHGAGIHGMAPWRRKLQAIFFAAGPGVAAGRRLGIVRSEDVAPTIAELLGIPPPRHATGRPLLLR